MKYKNSIWANFLLLCLLLVPCIALFFNTIVQRQLPAEVSLKEHETVAAFTEEYLAKSLPYSAHMRELALELRYFAGAREQQGVFIAENRLMNNVSTIDGNAVEKNKESLLYFLEALDETQLPYVMLIPTATGIMRQKVPTYTQPVNQRNFIDNTYNQLVEIVPTVDVYHTLLQNQDKYLYYRTEDNLTPMGGYYIYEQVSKRLLGATPPPRNAYRVDYVEDNYYGNLYRKAPFRKVEPDVLMEYSLTNPEQAYQVMRWENGNRMLLEGLYDRNQRGMNRYLGGPAEQIKIESQQPAERRLLVIGDRTAISYLSFLAGDFKEVLFLDVTQPQSVFVDAASYSHILLAVGADTYFSTDAVGACLTTVAEGLDSRYHAGDESPTDILVENK